LTGVGDLSFPPLQPGATHVYHLLFIESDKRDALREHLGRAGIDALIHYPTPIHLQPAYAWLNLKIGSLPVSERRARRTLSLPMFAELTAAQIERVASEIKGFFGR
jgi:dTDP-4-amino-4,6-dideoxygalactose transaminase